MRILCGEDGVVAVGWRLVRSWSEGMAALLDRYQESFVWTNRKPLDATDSAIGFALDRRCVKSQELTAPPETLCPFLGNGCEPILPKHGSHLAWGLMRKGILLKKRENVIVIGKQPHFGAGHNRIVAP